MFGRKARKQAEQEALRRMLEEAEANRRAAQEAAYEAEHQSKVYYDSEILFDEEDMAQRSQFDYNDEGEMTMEDIVIPPIEEVVALPIHEEMVEGTAEVVEDKTSEEAPLHATQQEPMQETAQEPVQEVAQEPVQETAEEPVQEVVQEPLQDVEEEELDDDAEQGTKIRYVVDGPTEEDELVKPAKLVKLPNLIDYMLSLKMSKKMKINVATLLIGAYAKYKDIPAEKAIVIDCMKKVMTALMH